ncbi:hypothetical protein B0I35DRAFT_479859 [Stachybotrys elegans]|uniref:Uncharacterized protein n=1 Tax=Stachybotrys elegans TaxID=80388 RepID=A0A8K0SRN5_9HYPO|nr:hypothetical protein B0I35DRAFT_479859 [Stachybotrys elegans]
MKLTLVTLLAALALNMSGADANTHRSMVCYNVKYIGVPPARSEITNKDATRCACKLYRERNTGDEKWDQCPDCEFNESKDRCISEGEHLGGKEMEEYCVKHCDSDGARARG